MKQDGRLREKPHWVKIILTGESAAGKSTALLAVLAETECRAEGFVSRRILSKSGRRLCFEHLGTAELNEALDAFRARFDAEERRELVAAFYEGVRREDNPFALWAEKLLTGVSDKEGKTKDTPAERRQFTELLRRFSRSAAKESKSLLIADEIGGLELTDDDLYDELLDLYACPNHMLLVLKSRAQLEHMSRYRGLPAEERVLLLERRDALEKRFKEQSRVIDCSEIRGERERAERIAGAAELLREKFGN